MTVGSPLLLPCVRSSPHPVSRADVAVLHAPAPAPSRASAPAPGMASKSTGLEERLRSLLYGVQSEAGVLDRVVYKHKNQHRRCPYFQSLLNVRRDVRLLLSACLGEIFNNLFPIIDAKRPAHKAHVPNRPKKNSSSGKYSYLERLLGVVRLLSQMAEPILKAATQISLLLAKSFFAAFSVTVLALLARLRVLVQQMLLDLVVVFNKVASLSQNKHSVKLINEGIEAYREYYPCSRDIPMLDCVWERDKFVLLERTHQSCTSTQDENQEVPMEKSIQYETVNLFNQVQSNEHELGLENRCEDFTIHDSSLDEVSNANYANMVEDSDNGGHSVSKRVPVVSHSSGGNLVASIDSVTDSKSVECQAKPKAKVAFIPLRKSMSSETSSSRPNKKTKFDLPTEDAGKSEDPFLNLLMGGGNMKPTLF